MSDILFEEKNGTGFITLNRTKALNALSHEMITQMAASLKAWRHDDSIKAVLVQSNSDKAFCAGGDVKWLYDVGLSQENTQLNFFWDEYRLNYAISQYPKPYISLLDGITMGGGVGISLHGSHPIATENFRFAMPETSIGFFPDIGGGHLLAHCHGRLGWYLGLTGAKIDREDALEAGLLKHCLQRAQLPEFVNALCDMNWSAAPFQDVDALLASFNADCARSSLACHHDDIQACFSKNSVQDILSALGEQDNEWCLEVKTRLEKKSPLSLCLTFEQLKRAEHQDLAQSLMMEYRMVTHVMQGHDFYEGVRALLVDKDNAPKWEPGDLNGVTKPLIERYFATLEKELVLER